MRSKHGQTQASTITVNTIVRDNTVQINNTSAETEIKMSKKDVTSHLKNGLHMSQEVYVSNLVSEQEGTMNSTLPSSTSKAIVNVEDTSIKINIIVPTPELEYNCVSSEVSVDKKQDESISKINKNKRSRSRSMKESGKSSQIDLSSIVINPVNIS